MEIEAQKDVLTFMLRLSKYLDGLVDVDDAGAIYLTCCRFVRMFDPRFLDANVRRIHEFTSKNTPKFRDSLKVYLTYGQSALLESIIFDFLKKTPRSSFENCSNQKFTQYVMHLMGTFRERDISTSSILKLRDALLNQSVEELNLSKAALATLVDISRKWFAPVGHEPSLISPEFVERLSGFFGEELSVAVLHRANKVASNSERASDDTRAIITASAELLKSGSAEDLQIVIDALTVVDIFGLGRTTPKQTITL